MNEKTQSIGKPTYNEVFTMFLGYSFDNQFNHLSNGRMGHKYSYYTHQNGRTTFPNIDSRFESWDGLIPLIQKITKVIKKKNIPYGISGGISIAEKIMTLSIQDSTIKEVKKYCYKFIRWYNNERGLLSQEPSVHEDTGFSPHQTLVVGWKDGKIIYCRTFDDKNDRENMFKGFDYVRGISDKFIMTSEFDNVIRQEDKTFT